MTYLEALNRYWRVTDERLGVNEAGLYYALIDVANKPKWNPIFQVGNDVLCVKLGITEKALRKCRQNLIDAGLISVEIGKGRSVTIYNLEGSKSTAQMSAQTTVQESVQMSALSTAQMSAQRGDNRGVNKLPPEDIRLPSTPRQEDREGTPPNESSAFDKLFGEISAMLLGHAGDIWREEMSKTHGVTDFEKAFAQFRSYLIQNALERNIQSQSDFRRYFNWRAKEFMTDEAKKAPVKYFATIEKLSDTQWVVHQYGGTDPIPVGTPDPPSPYHAWTGTQWEHV